MTNEKCSNISPRERKGNKSLLIIAFSQPMSDLQCPISIRFCHLTICDKIQEQDFDLYTVMIFHLRLKVMYGDTLQLKQ